MIELAVVFIVVDEPGKVTDEERRTYSGAIECLKGSY